MTVVLIVVGLVLVLGADLHPDPQLDDRFAEPRRRGVVRHRRPAEAPPRPGAEPGRDGEGLRDSTSARPSRRSPRRAPQAMQASGPAEASPAEGLLNAAARRTCVRSPSSTRTSARPRTSSSSRGTCRSSRTRSRPRAGSTTRTSRPTTRRSRSSRTRSSPLAAASRRASSSRSRTPPSASPSRSRSRATELDASRAGGGARSQSSSPARALPARRTSSRARRTRARSARATARRTSAHPTEVARLLHEAGHRRRGDPRRDVPPRRRRGHRHDARRDRGGFGAGVRDLVAVDDRGQGHRAVRAAQGAPPRPGRGGRASAPS